MPRKKTPEPVVAQEAAPEADLIAIVEPAAPAVQTHEQAVEHAQQERVGKSDMQPAWEGYPGLNANKFHETYLEAEEDNRQYDFMREVIKARVNPEPVHTIPDAHPRILEQTRLEMEAGKKMNEHWAAQQANRPAPRPEPGDGKNETVFRPDAYIPDPKKNTGHVNARELPARG